MSISREDLAPRDWPRSDRIEWNLQSALRRLREARKAFANAAGHPQRASVVTQLDRLQVYGKWYSQADLRNIIAKYAYLHPAAPEFQTPDPVKERIG